MLGAVMRHAGLKELPLEARQPFCFGEGGILPQALEAEGFTEIQETRHTVPTAWPASPEVVNEYWWTAVAPPFQPIVNRLAPEARDRAMAETVEQLRKHYSNGVVQLRASVILATGSKGAAPPVSMADPE